MTVGALACPTGTRLYRASPMSAAEGPRPAGVERLATPPAEFVGNFHRAGVPLGPMFYAGLSVPTALVEVRAQLGQTIPLSEWVTTAPLLLVTAGFAASTFEAWGYEGSRVPSFAHPNERTSNGVDPRLRTSNGLILEFAARQFARSVVPSESYRYRVSALITRMLGVSSFSTTRCGFVRGQAYGNSETGPSQDGVVYPSTVRRGSGVNVALRPFSATTCLSFVGVGLQTMVGKADGTLHAQETDFATCMGNDSSLLWWGRERSSWERQAAGRLGAAPPSDHAWIELANLDIWRPQSLFLDIPYHAKSPMG